MPGRPAPRSVRSGAIDERSAPLTAQTLDQARVEAFAGRLMELYTGGMLTYLVDIGHRTGLFATLAEGPATSAELAARADLQERYVREWLAGLARGGGVGRHPRGGRLS